MNSAESGDGSTEPDSVDVESVDVESVDVEWVDVEIVDGPAAEYERWEFEADDVDFLDDEDGDEDPGVEPEPFVYDATVAPGDPAMPDLLLRGDIEVLGLMPWSSNGTYLVEVRDGDDHAPAIYKPERGERPLWDFPGGLWRREVATSVLSDAMGVALVPPTVERSDDDAPIGRGSLQAFVPARFAEHYFTLRERPELRERLQTLCAFDLVANSADRKGGHCLIDAEDRIWAIDNGLTFHEEFKVRTVVWDWSGDPLPLVVAESLMRLLDAGLPSALDRLLSPGEREAVLNRTRRLLSNGVFPHDETGRRYPWPLV